MKKFLMVFLLFPAALIGQISTTLYQPSVGSGLSLNLAAGQAFCSGSTVTYAGGSLALTGSTTNYVYLNTSSSCVPAVKTSAFSSVDIPLATVTTNSAGIVGITDNRTMFYTAPSSSAFLSASIVGSVTSNIFSPVTIVRAATLENITAIVPSSTFTCGTLTIVIEDCGVSTTCSSPSTLGSVSLTSGNTIFSGSISNSAIIAGHFLAWQVTAGSCGLTTANVTAEYRVN